MRKINEIFSSLQGEGHHTGATSVFVRFSGCNLGCPFCDTSHGEGVMMSDEAIIAEAASHQAEWTILTGGEPTLQIDEGFVSRLKEATRRPVAIETNGTRPVPPNVDWVTVSPKLQEGEAGRVRALHADEIKVVDTGQDLEQYFRLPCRKDATLMYLQPCWTPDPATRAANLRRTVARVLADPRWRLSLQTHKLIDIP